jgi:hypothetical protein
MSDKRNAYAYLVSNSMQQVWVFHRHQAAEEFARLRQEEARLAGSSTHYEVLQLPYSDAARPATETAAA